MCDTVTPGVTCFSAYFPCMNWYATASGVSTHTLSSALSAQAMLSAMTGSARSTSRSWMTADTSRPSCRDMSLLLPSVGRIARLLHTCALTQQHNSELPQDSMLHRCDALHCQLLNETLPGGVCLQHQLDLLDACQTC